MASRVRLKIGRRVQDSLLGNASTGIIPDIIANPDYRRDLLGG